MPLINCYARELMFGKMEPLIRRAYEAAGLPDWQTRKLWGPNAPRVITKGFWQDVYKWNSAAAWTGERARIFPSLIDWLDDMPAGAIDQDGNSVPADDLRLMFLVVVYLTSYLDWLLLTKRPQNFFSFLEGVRGAITGNEPLGFLQWLQAWEDGQPPDNVWIGVSIEDRDRLRERHTQLMEIPAKVHFWSVEPLIGKFGPDEVIGQWTVHRAPDWVIIGGESGPHRRPMDLLTAEYLAAVCSIWKIPVYVKQDSAPLSEERGRFSDEMWALKEFPL